MFLNATYLSKGSLAPVAPWSPGAPGKRRASRAQTSSARAHPTALESQHRFTGMYFIPLVLGPSPLFQHRAGAFRKPRRGCGASSRPHQLLNVCGLECMSVPSAPFTFDQHCSDHCRNSMLSESHAWVMKPEHKIVWKNRNAQLSASWRGTVEPKPYTVSEVKHSLETDRELGSLLLVTCCGEGCSSPPPFTTAIGTSLASYFQAASEVHGKRLIHPGCNSKHRH